MTNANFIDSIAESGNLDLLMHVFTRYYQMPTYAAMDKASQNGHADVVWFLIVCYHAPHWRALDFAAENGHLDIVKMLCQYRDERCTRTGVDSAVRNGHLHVVKWLHAKTGGVGCSREAAEAISLPRERRRMLDWIDAHPEALINSAEYARYQSSQRRAALTEAEAEKRAALRRVWAVRDQLARESMQEKRRQVQQESDAPDFRCMQDIHVILNNREVSLRQRQRSTAAQSTLSLVQQVLDERSLMGSGAVMRPTLQLLPQTLSVRDHGSTNLFDSDNDSSGDSDTDTDEEVIAIKREQDQLAEQDNDFNDEQDEKFSVVIKREQMPTRPTMDDDDDDDDVVFLGYKRCPDGELTNEMPPAQRHRSHMS
jgi:hypothetical protein